MQARDDDQGGIAGMLYQGDIATLFLDHVYFLRGVGYFVERSIFLRSVDKAEESGSRAIRND